MTFQIAERLRGLPDYPFVAIEQEVRQLKAQGRDIISLNVGSPDMPPPPHVIQKLIDCVSRPDTHGYSSYRGTPAFREAVARYYKRTFNVDLDPECEVLPLIGSKEGIVNFTFSAISPGDLVLLPSPAYPAYEAATLMAQGRLYSLPLRAENGFLPDLEAIPLEVARQAKILWINYPNNPTGALATLEDYRRIFAFCQQYEITLASDNPYFAIVFDGSRPVSALQADPSKSRTIEFMSLSKTYHMAGWRLGAAVGNAEAIAALLTVKSNMDSGHFAAIYEAGVTAINDTSQEWIDESNQLLYRRAQLLIEAAPQIGLHLDVPPKGSLYLWLRVGQGDDIAYCHDALHQANVSLVPGSIYGEAGKGYIRISVVMPENRIMEAIDRLRRWWDSRE
jgi:LL-diaminopimelate aminotransferase